MKSAIFEKQKGEEAYITGEEYHHLVKVRRIKKGELVRITDGAGKNYLAIVEYIDRIKKLVRVRIVSYNLDTELDFKLGLGFALIKKPRLEFLLEKCTELGVAEFIPLICERSIVLKSEVEERWLKILKEAVKQSGRSRIPEIRKPLRLEKIEEIAQNYDTWLFGDINGEKLIPEINPEGDILVIIGPEGGFTENEKKFLLSKGFLNVKLAKTILRAETAAISACSQIIAVRETNGRRLKTQGGDACVRSQTA